MSRSRLLNGVDGKMVKEEYVEDPHQWHTWSPLPPKAPPDPILLEDIILLDSDEPLYKQLLDVVSDINIEEDEKTVANGTKARFSALLRLVHRARYELPYDLPILKRKFVNVYGPTTHFPSPRMMMLQLWTYKDIKSEMQYLLTYANPDMGDLKNETEFFNPSVIKPSLDDLGVDCLGYDKWTRGHGRQGFQAVTHWGVSQSAGSITSYAGRGLDPKHRYGIVRDFGSYGVSTTHNPHFMPSRVIFACCGEKVGQTKGCWIMIDKTQELGKPVSYEVMLRTDPWPRFTKRTISLVDLTNELVADIRVGTAFRRVNLKQYLGWHNIIKTSWNRLAPLLAQAILAYLEQIYDASSSDEPLPMNPYGLFVQGTAAEPLIKDMIHAIVRFNEIHCAWDVHPSSEGQWATVINERLFKTGSVRVNFDASTLAFIIFEGFTGGDETAPERITLLRIGDSDDVESLKALVGKLNNLKETWNLNNRPDNFASEVEKNVNFINTLIEDTSDINTIANRADNRRIFIDQWKSLLLKTQNLADADEKAVVDTYIKDVDDFETALDEADSALTTSRKNINNTLKKLHRYAMEPSDDTQAILNDAEDLFDDVITNSTQKSTDLSDTTLAEAEDLVVFAAPFQRLIDKLALYEAATEPGRNMPSLPENVNVEMLNLPSIITSESLAQYLLNVQDADIDNIDVNNILEDLVTITRVPSKTLEKAEEVLDGASVLVRTLPNVDAQTKRVVEELSVAKLNVESQLNQRLLEASKLAGTTEKLIKGLYATEDDDEAYEGALELLSNENSDLLELGPVDDQLLLDVTQKVREEQERLEELARANFRDIIGNTSERCLNLSKALTQQLDSVPLSRTIITELGGANGEYALKKCIYEIRSVLNNPFPVELTSIDNPITNERMMTMLDNWKFTVDQVFPLPSDGARDYAPYTKYWLSRIFMPILNFMNVLRVLDDLTAANIMLTTLESPQERAAIFERLEELGLEAAAERARRQAERAQRKETVFTNIEGVVEIPNVVVLPRTGQPLFTTSNFNNTRNTCPIDTVLTLLFKIPRTWLEMDVMRVANRVRVYGANCEREDAIKLHEYLLRDLTLMQGNAVPHECKSAQSFVSCVKTPLEFNADNNEFVYSEPEVIYDNIRAFYMVNERNMPKAIDLEARSTIPGADPNKLELDASKYRINPSDMNNNNNNNNNNARLLAFTSPTDLGSRFGGLNNTLKDIVQPPGTNFTLAGVVLKRPAHFTVAMRDPRNGDWWYYDASEYTYMAQNMSREGNGALIDPETGIFLGIQKSVTIVQPRHQRLTHRPVFWLYMRNSDLKRTDPSASIPIPLPPTRPGPRAFELSALADRILSSKDTSAFNNATNGRGVVKFMSELKSLDLPLDLAEQIGFDVNTRTFQLPDKIKNAPVEKQRLLLYVWDQLRQNAANDTFAPNAGATAQNIRIALLALRLDNLPEYVPPSAPPTGEPGIRVFSLSAAAERVLRTENATPFNNAINDKRQVKRMVTQLEKLSLPSNLDEMIGFNSALGTFSIPDTMARVSLDRKRALVYMWDQIRQATPDNIQEVEQNIRIALLSARVPQPGTAVEPFNEPESPPPPSNRPPRPQNNKIFAQSKKQFPVPPDFNLNNDENDILEELSDEPDRFQAYLYYKYQEQLSPKDHPDRENNMRFAKLAGRLAFL